MRYGFYISEKSTRLRKYLTSECGKKKINDIKLVVSDVQMENDFYDLLSGLGIYTVEVNRYELGSSNSDRNLAFSDLMLEELVKNNIDYVFSFGSHLLSGKILKVYANRIINFHPAILPMYPGINAIDRAVKDNKSFLIGNTAHFVDEGVDSGKIIMQSCMPLAAFRKTNDYDLVLDIQIEMLDKLIDIINNNALKVNGDFVEIDGADYFTENIYPDWTVGETK